MNGGGLFTAKQVIELAGNQQTTFTDLVAQLGLASALRPDGEYTLLAPVNNAFSGMYWSLSFLSFLPYTPFFSTMNVCIKE